MARAKFNMWASLQGEMGQIVFVEAPGGFIARQHNPEPRKSTSPAVLASRARFRRVAAFWSALDTSTRETWNAWASEQGREPGALTDPTGYSKFSGLANVWLNSRNDVGTPPSNPPVGEFGGSVAVLTAAASSGSVTFHSSSSTEAGVLVQFELQALKRASRKPSKDGYKVAGFGALEISEGNEFTVAVAPGAYAARYCFVEASSGRRTPFVEIPVSGVALAVETGGAEAEASARKKAA